MYTVCRLQCRLFGAFFSLAELDGMMQVEVGFCQRWLQCLERLSVLVSGGIALSMGLHGMYILCDCILAGFEFPV